MHYFRLVFFVDSRHCTKAALRVRQSRTKIVYIYSLAQGNHVQI